MRFALDLKPLQASEWIISLACWIQPCFFFVTWFIGNASLMIFAGLFMRHWRVLTTICISVKGETVSAELALTFAFSTTPVESNNKLNSAKQTSSILEAKKRTFFHLSYISRLNNNVLRFPCPRVGYLLAYTQASCRTPEKSGCLSASTASSWRRNASPRRYENQAVRTCCTLVHSYSLLQRKNGGELRSTQIPPFPAMVC